MPTLRSQVETGRSLIRTQEGSNGSGAAVFLILPSAVITVGWEQLYAEFSDPDYSVANTRISSYGQLRIKISVTRDPSG